MKRYFMIRVLFAMTLVVIFTINNLFAQKRIMPLGDSNTAGVVSGDPIGGYRDDLDALLTDAGINFNFVGTLNDGAGFDADHEGHNGMRADEIANNLASWFNTLGSQVPRFIMLQIGTNDISQGQTPQSTADDIADILDVIFNNADYNCVILSSVLPRNDEHDAEVTQLNLLIKNLYYTKRAEGYNIHYLGLNEIFKSNGNWVNDYLHDQRHPNNDGFNLMAQGFFNALMNGFHTFDQHVPVVTDYFTRAELGVTWAADAEFVIDNNELSNSSTENGWDYLAVYKAQTDPTNVAIEWSANADAAGIGEGGLALKLDAPNSNANGYLCWYSSSGVRLWTISNGAPSNQIDIKNTTLPFPVAGDTFEIEMFSDESGHHFKCYINDQEDVTLTDPNKIYNGSYAGVMLKGDLNNNVNSFNLLGSEASIPSDDTTPPGTVSDLSAGSPTSNSITLTWTAVGDDGMDGTASYYDVRYSSNPINNGTDFNQANQASGEPSPAVSGTQETFIITGLSPNTTYHFALKVYDEASNESGMSNSPNETTIASDDTIAPATVSDLSASSPASNSITLTWTAVGDDDMVGTASYYDVRYSTNPINNGTDYDQATQATGEPTPAVAGTQETFVVNGLSTNTTYHFALKVFDEASNKSGLSNSASETTIQTAIQYTVDTFDRQTLGPNWIANESFQIDNNELSNSTTTYDWGYLALYKPIVNPVEVSIRWGTSADQGGIEEGGLALMMSDSSITANGYFIWLRPSNRSINLYAIVNGWPDHRIGSKVDMEPGAPTIEAGSVFKVKLTSDTQGHHFECYLNDQYIGTISDPNKEKGNTPAKYTGVNLKGNLNNNVDDFTLGVLGEVDNTPPDPITDLAVTNTGITTVTLGWTAVGDDGMDGNASSYDIRYSMDPIGNENDFDAADQAVGVPNPAAPGSQESFLVTGLESNTTYYFAIKVFDEMSNYSLSNTASAKTKSANIVTDNFNRTDLGANWNADPEFQIENEELANTAQTNSWNYLAVYNARTNPIEVSFKWGSQATSSGIEEGGMALRLDTASPDASGYAVWIRPSLRRIQLWTIVNGNIGSSVTYKSMEGGAPTPQAGYVFKVQLSSDNQGHHFDCFVNEQFAGRVSDPDKLEGNDAEQFAGVILKGGLNNNVDDFSEINVAGNAQFLEYVSGDGQFGTIGEKLPNKLIVKVLDQNRIPVANYKVDYRVINGDATLDLSPPDNNVRIEAETGQLTSPMQIGYDDAASGGQYVSSLTGQPKEGKAEYSFYLPVAGNYEIWGRIYAPSGEEDSYFYVVDGTADTLEYHLLSPYNTWRWKKFQNQNGVVFRRYLDAGQHSLSLIKRENNARIDKIIFTADPSFTPSGKEEVPGYFTDASGEAAAEVTLGNNVGQITVRAETPGLEGSPVDFNLTARAGDAVRIELVSGNDQSGAGGQQLSQPFVVKLFDMGDNPVFGWPVTFQEIEGGGFPSSSQPVVSDETGLASCYWTLGTEQANNVIHAISEGLTGSPVVFTATATSNVADSLVYSSGDGQVGVVGTPLTNPFKVKVIDGQSNPIQNHRVGFKVIGGGGTLDGSPETEKEILTDASGFAQVTLTLGDTAGIQNNLVEAKAMGAGQNLKGSPFIFKASANPDVPSKIEYVSGNSQTGAAGLPLGAPFIVRVVDQYGNGIDAHEVNFQVKNGGGSLNPNGPWYTEGGGFSQVTLTLGSESGVANEVWASAQYSGTQLTNSPVVFQATAGTVTTMEYVSGNNQTGSAGYPVEDSLKVKILDNYGNPVGGYPVTFSTLDSPNPGTLNGTEDQLLVVNTNDIGVAEVMFYCGSSWGEASQAKAIVEGLTGSPQIFNINVADLSELEYVSGNGQSGVVGSQLENPFRVKVLDDLGKSMPNVRVAFIVTQGNGNFSGSPTIDVFTDSENHFASATLTLGPNPGNNNNVAQATVTYKGNQLGSPITFYASGTAGQANELVEVSGNYGAAVVGNPIENPFVVKVIDSYGNAVSGHSVKFTVKAGGGTFVDNNSTTVTKLTSINGRAQVYLTVGLNAGINNNEVEVVSFKSGTQTNLVGSPRTFYASGLSSPATKMEYLSGNGQPTSPVRSAMTQPFRVKITDNHNNAVPDHPVNWFVVQGGGTFNNLVDSTKTIRTDNNGIAEVYYYPGPVAGITNEVKAQSFNGPELNNSPITFTVNTKAAAVSADRSEVIATGPVPADGQSQSTITVTLMDDYANRVQGKALSMFATGSSNSITPFTSLTDQNGQAVAYLASTKAETKKVIILNVSDSITLSDTTHVKFLPLAANSIGYVSGTNQSSNFETACNDPIEARIVDVHGNVISGYPVFFEAYVGGGYIYEQQPVYTDSNGIASSYWVLGDQEVNRARAKADGLANSPVEYIATANSGVASKLEYVIGNQQTGTAGYALPQPLVVKVVDDSGDPIANYPVNYKVEFGGGNFNGKSTLDIYTDVFGKATASFTIGRVAGSKIASANTPDLAGSPQRFTAMGVAGPAQKIVKHSGDNSSISVNGGRWVRVKVTDLYDNAVSGYEVIYSVIQGDATIRNGYEKAISDADGLAGTIVDAGMTLEAIKVIAVAPGLIGDGLIFNLTVVARPAVSIEIYHGNNQEGTVGRELVYPLSVVVKDEYGNPAGGQNIPITFALTGNKGILLDTQVNTDEKGIASARLQLEDATGPLYKVWAIKSGLSGSPLEFAATGVTNKFPMYSEIPDYNIDENESLNFSVSATDDDGDPVTYGIRKLPDGATFDSLGARQFNWKPNYFQSGEYTVHFMAWDNRGGFDDEPVTINVANVNRLPQIINYEPIAFQIVGHKSVGEIFRFMVQATDADNDILSYKWYNNDILVSTKNYYDCDVSTQSLYEHIIKVQVSDGYDTVEHTWNLFIKTPVELASFSGQVVERKGIELIWETASEHNLAGFNIFKKSNSQTNYEKINTSPIKPDGTKEYHYLDSDVKVGHTYSYKLEDVAITGESTQHDPIRVFVEKPQEYMLSQNYPNPFNATTHIRYQLPDQNRVTIKIYNILGQEVRTLVDEVKEAGYHAAIWDGFDKYDNPVGSGVYYYRIMSGSFVQSKKMVLLK